MGFINSDYIFDHVSPTIIKMSYNLNVRKYWDFSGRVSHVKYVSTVGKSDVWFYRRVCVVTQVGTTAWRSMWGRSWERWWGRDSSKCASSLARCPQLSSKPWDSPSRCLTKVRTPSSPQPLCAPMLLSRELTIRREGVAALVCLGAIARTWLEYHEKRRIGRMICASMFCWLAGGSWGPRDHKTTVEMASQQSVSVKSHYYFSVMTITRVTVTPATSV